jgi:hypothetical protein
MEERLFTLKDGRKTKVHRIDLFEWVVSDFTNCEEDIEKCLNYVRVVMRDLKKIHSAIQALFDGGDLLLVLKAGDDLTGEGIADQDIVGVELHRGRGRRKPTSNPGSRAIIEETRRQEVEHGLCAETTGPIRY